MARFYRRGVSKMYFVPGTPFVTNPSIATNLTSARDISGQVAEIGGFEVQNEPIETPNLNDKFTPKIDGPDNVADSSLTLYDDDGGLSAIRALMPKAQEGTLVLCPYGVTTTKRCEMWPVKVSGNNDQWTVGNDPARYVVQFVVTAVPNQNAAIAA